jgi:hypothetical protein
MLEMMSWIGTTVRLCELEGSVWKYVEWNMNMAYLSGASFTAAVLSRRAAIVPPTDPPTATPITIIQIMQTVNQNVVAFMFATRLGSPRGDFSARSFSPISACKDSGPWRRGRTSGPS